MHTHVGDVPDSHTDTAALPFPVPALKGPRPRVLPRGYIAEPKTLGEQIRKRRLDLGLRQCDLAVQFGVNYMTVATWESGKSRPLIHIIPKLRAFLGEAEPNLPEDLPSRIREIRLRLGLTQEGLAKAVGQDESQICRWEGGRESPHPAIRARLEAELLRLAGGTPLPMHESFYRLTRWRRSLPASCAATPPETFGEQLRLERLKRGVSLIELAARLQVSRAALLRVEKGLVSPSLSERKEMLDAVILE